MTRPQRRMLDDFYIQNFDLELEAVEKNPLTKPATYRYFKSKPMRGECYSGNSLESPQNVFRFSLYFVQCTPEHSHKNLDVRCAFPRCEKVVIHGPLTNLSNNLPSTIDTILKGQKLFHCKRVTVNLLSSMINTFVVCHRLTSFIDLYI